MAVSPAALAEWDQAHVIHPWSFDGPSLIIARGRGPTHSYHGVTYGALSATGLPGLQAGFGELPGGFIHLTTPYPYRQELFGGADPFEFCLRELEETIERVGASNIAAFIGEPVLTVGGV